MAVTLAQAGALATTGTGSLVVAHPAASTAGRWLTLPVGIKPSARTATAPTGWAVLAGLTGGAGSSGADTGQTRLYVFGREADGVETSTTITLSGNGNPGMGLVVAYDKTVAGAWAVASTTADDATQATGVDAITGTFAADPGITAGDLVEVTFHATTDAGVFTSPDLAVPGCTVGAGTVAADEPTVSGNDGRLYVVIFPVTAGSSTGAATFTVDVDALNASAGPMVLTRLREPAASGVAVGRAVESDTARGLTASRQLAVARGVETDTARAVTTSKSLALARGVEVDTARALSVTKSPTLGRAVEVDTARPVTTSKSLVLGRAVETGTPRGVTTTKRTVLGRAAETDTARGVTVPSQTVLGRAVEGDVARPVTASKSLVLGRAVETGTARPVTTAKAAVLGRGVEVDLARAGTVATPGGGVNITLTAAARLRARTATAGAGNTATGRARTVEVAATARTATVTARTRHTVEARP